jgi:drug/metabolite transporter (DMT)-like permease
MVDLGGMAARLSMSATDWLLLVFLSILWGGSFFFAKIAVDELPPLTLALGRVAIAAAVLAPLVGVAGLVSLARAWPAFAVLGLLNNVLPFTLIFWGQTHIPSGLASIFNATTPIFTALIAHFATRDEKLNAAKLIGVITGFVGVVAMLGAALLALAVLSTALAYVIYFRILARAGATNLLLVTFLIPVSAILLGTAVLGEQLAPHHFVGMAIIAVGLAAIDGRPGRLMAHAFRPNAPP